MAQEWKGWALRKPDGTLWTGSSRVVPDLMATRREAREYRVDGETVVRVTVSIDPEPTPAPGLPWVSNRLPTADDADEFGGVIWCDEQGRTDLPWWTASWNNEQSIAVHTHWCRCSAIAPPGQHRSRTPADGEQSKETGDDR